MIKKIKNFLYEKVIMTHGWQVPVRLFVKYEHLKGTYSSMSQGGQDLMVLDLLNNKSNGTFVDLGGSNGVTSSNTYILEKQHGWTGLCIEANKRFYRHLTKNRKCKTHYGVVADEEKHVQFNNDGATGSIASEGVTMQALPLSKILEMHDMPKIIDYLSLDVEGFEEDVLYNFPFDTYRFRIMSIERPSDALHERLISRGYHLHAKLEPDGNWLDNIYVDPELLGE